MTIHPFLTKFCMRDDSVFNLFGLLTGVSDNHHNVYFHDSRGSRAITSNTQAYGQYASSLHAERLGIVVALIKTHERPSSTIILDHLDSARDIDRMRTPNFTMMAGSPNLAKNSTDGYSR